MFRFCEENETNEDGNWDEVQNEAGKQGDVGISRRDGANDQHEDGTRCKDGGCHHGCLVGDVQHGDGLVFSRYASPTVNEI